MTSLVVLKKPLPKPTSDSLAVQAANTPEGRAALSDLTSTEAALLQYRWKFWARPSQLPPDGDWGVWLLMTGRGFGKTRAGAEWVIEQAKTPNTRIAMIGRIPSDARDVMIEGESGVMKSSPPDFRPRYIGTARTLKWPNGSEALIYSSESPDDLRGPNFHCAWVDELAKYSKAQDLWDTLVMAVRLPPNPRIVVTTTPRPIPIIRSLVADKSTHVTSGSSYDNRANLSEKFFNRLISRYEGTYLGQQELQGLLINDRPGALWTRETIERNRVEVAPDLARVVVAIDPPATAGEDSAEAGIVVVGRNADGVGYVLRDASQHATPDEWGSIAVRLYDEYKADSIVVETNQGGDMVLFTVAQCAKALHQRGERDTQTVTSTPVRATRGKLTRAEPIAALYAQGRVHHVGLLADLEDQLASWVPGENSPDRLDAMVWGLTAVMIYAGGDLDVWGGISNEDTEHIATETAKREGVWFPPSFR